MTTLDKFVEMEPMRDGSCSVCGRVGVLEFQDKDGETCSLCGHCIYESEGRYKNRTPSELLKQFETVTRSYLSTDELIYIETSSFLGDFTHVFYLGRCYDIIDSNDGTEDSTMSVQAKLTFEIEGKSEVFERHTGNFMSGLSAHTDVAMEFVDQYNSS